MYSFKYRSTSDKSFEKAIDYNMQQFFTPLLNDSLNDNW